MGMPTGEIVERPLVTRRGCVREIRVLRGGQLRAAGQVLGDPVRGVVADLAEEQRRAAAALPKKGEACRQLPARARVTTTRQPDGRWSGSGPRTTSSSPDRIGPAVVAHLQPRRAPS